MAQHGIREHLKSHRSTWPMRCCLCHAELHTYVEHVWSCLGSQQHTYSTPQPTASQPLWGSCHCQVGSSYACTGILYTSMVIAIKRACCAFTGEFIITVIKEFTSSRGICMQLCMCMPLTTGYLGQHVVQGPRENGLCSEARSLLMLAPTTTPTSCASNNNMQQLVDG